MIAIKKPDELDINDFGYKNTSLKMALEGIPARKICFFNRVVVSLGPQTYTRVVCGFVR